MADLAVNQTHVIFVTGAVYKNRQLLIGKRSLNESHEPGKWALPGGKVDQTNGKITSILEKTVAREVEEETGILINHKKIKYIFSNTFIRSTGHHVVAAVFLCPWSKGEAKQLEDTDEVAWINEQDITKYNLARGMEKYLKIAFKHLTSMV